ncbi:MAG TPA: lysophospholipid acyltransferase family protein [Spirochaetota bacterium]|nr:lysophospholipid acyltransferase family protein [Spirochaetota bacterium]HOS38709.1 lysophospholipid acyltransferase family protein [Spirochaetota bacterium]HPI21703.1 lysophospholipid acyltransferase family protein [Spirochaetota bacterium]HPU86772.1 lysophospholipid acyltransferase family protein [Spirochaetota bacterium]
MKRFLFSYVGPYVGLAILKSLTATYRIRIVDEENEQSIYRRGSRPIYCSWHQRFFPGIAFFPKRNKIAIMISPSADGELIARVVKILGWHPSRGSSSRRGKEALMELRRLAAERYSIGHIVDGPKGPFGEVKPGLISMAQHSGLPILPTITSAERRWVFGSWDRFMVPKPFSRIIIRFGKEIPVPSEIGDAQFEELRRQVERTLRELYEDTDRMWERAPQAS